MIRKILFVLGLALSLAGLAVAAPPVAGPVGYGSPVVLGDDELIIEEVFQSHLPTLLKKYALRLSVHPRLGDWHRKDHMRLSTTLRYGLTERCEISAGSHLYFSHGNGAVKAFDDYGGANLRFGLKYKIGRRLIPSWETAVGVDYDTPAGHPPAELIDGLRHLRPYVTFSHRLESRPTMRIFVGLRLDDVSQTSLPGEPGKNAFREDSTGITGGWVIDRDNLHYTFEAAFDTTRLIGSSHKDVVSLRPGLIWEIPTRRNRRIMSAWVAGVALNHTYGPGGSSLGASFKLRYSRDLKIHRHRVPVLPMP
jgi:hypothetical protein